jgi:divalent metal cation (Fe/Co/Zn/Cd) transporter
MAHTLARESPSPHSPRPLLRRHLEPPFFGHLLPDLVLQGEFTDLALGIPGAIGVAVGFQRADAMMGLVITLALLSVLRTTARDIFRRLMDSVDSELVDQVEHVLAGVEGVDRVERVRIRWVGHQLQAEATIVSDAQLTLAAAHGIAERAHHQLLHEVPRLTEALIHSDPGTAGTAIGHELTAHHFAHPN